MSYCLNPTCPDPQNSGDRDRCQSCSSALRLQNRYVALKSIGQGGFGRTFLAIDEVDRSRCVIKQFFPQQWGADSRERASELFRQEALRLEELGDHPQIPTLLAYVEQENGQYLIQEFIDGSNLEQELSEDGAFSEAQIRQLLSDLLPVLQFLHDHQVIHRDIKPANIIRRTIDRKLVLVDMGAAKSATQTALAKTGTVIGSAEYAAPEQTRGKAVFASDLYSLGATCIHLLTQMSPFDLYDGSEGKWVWRDYLSQRVSDSLGHVLDKMLEEATRRRYSTVTEVLQDLRGAVPSPADHLTQAKNNRETERWQAIRANPAWRSSHPPATMNEHPGYKSRSRTRFNVDAMGALFYNPLVSRQTILAAEGSLPQERQKRRDANVPKILLLVLLSLGGLMAAWNVVRAPVPPPIDRPSESETRSSLIKPESIWNSAYGLGSLAFTSNGELVSVTATSSTNFGTQALNAVTGELLRSFEHACPSRMDTLNHLSPDGKMFASACNDGTVKVWDTQQGTLIQTLTGSTDSISEFTALAISPNGKTIVTGGVHNSIHFWDVQTGQLVKTLPRQANRVVQLVISPDGKTLVSRTSAVNTIQVWNWDGTLAHTLNTPQIDTSDIAISPDSQTLIVASRAEVSLWDLQTGEMIQMLTDEKQVTPLDEKIISIAISPNNQFVFTIGALGNLYVWDLQQGTLIQAVEAHHDPTWLRVIPTAIVLSPDGKRIITSGLDTIKVWRVDQLTSATESNRQ